MRRSPQAFSPSSKGRPKHEQKAELVCQAVCPGCQRLSALLRQSEKPLLDALRAQAEEYIEGGGDAAALEQRFGTPQQVAAAWVDERDTSELLAELHIHRRIVMVVALALAAVLVIFTGVLVWQQYMIHKDLSGWNEEIITVYKTTEMRESTE